jgi:hypothetical protein
LRPRAGRRCEPQTLTPARSFQHSLFLHSHMSISFSHRSGAMPVHQVEQCFLELQRKVATPHCVAFLGRGGAAEGARRGGAAGGAALPGAAAQGQGGRGEASRGGGQEEEGAGTAAGQERRAHQAVLPAVCLGGGTLGPVQDAA